MMPVAEKRFADQKSEPVWFWRFGSIESLQEDGLEQYTAFLDDGRIGRYGEWEPGGDIDATLEMCSVRKRAEIDHCLEELEYPFFRRLLHLYYRQGKSCEHQGWAEVAKIVGLRGDPKSRWDCSTFERQLDLAIDRCWHTHIVRCGRIR